MQHAYQSTPQILGSIEHVASDPIASALPRVAWKTPGLLHFRIGPLDLKTPARIEEAVRLLNAFSAEYQSRQYIIESRDPLYRRIRDSHHRPTMRI